MRRMYSKSQLQEIVKEELKADLFEHTVTVYNEDDDHGYGRFTFSYICTDATNLQQGKYEDPFMNLEAQVGLVTLPCSGVYISGSTDFDAIMLDVGLRKDKCKIIARLGDEFTIAEYLGSTGYTLEDNVRRIC